MKPRRWRSLPLHGRLPLALALLWGCAGEAEPEQDPRIAVGQEIFTTTAQPTCGTCHTLNAAGTAGAVGPNLDELKPDSARVAAAVMNGVGIMPAQGDQLTPEQIGALAYYVATVAGRPRE